MRRQRPAEFTAPSVQSEEANTSLSDFESSPTAAGCFKIRFTVDFVSGNCSLWGGSLPKAPSLGGQLFGVLLGPIVPSEHISPSTCHMGISGW
jgi:hypothetical protein